MSARHNMVLLGVFCLLPWSALAAQPMEIPKPDPTLPSGNDMMVSWLRMMGAFIIVLAIFFGGVMLFKKYGNMFQHTSRQGLLQVVEFKRLDQKNALHLIECHGERFLVTSGQGGAPGILRLNTKATHDSIAPNHTSTDFQGAISRAMRGEG